MRTGQSAHREALVGFRVYRRQSGSWLLTEAAYCMMAGSSDNYRARPVRRRRVWERVFKGFCLVRDQSTTQTSSADHLVSFLSL